MDVQISTLSGQQVVGGIVGIGIAAFGTVDASRTMFSNIDYLGFNYVQEMVVTLTPEGDGIPENTLSQADILKAVKANWMIGLDLAFQKESAKSFVKMHLTPANAAAVAKRINLNPALLVAAAAHAADGVMLSVQEIDIHERFELVVTALLDQAFQEASRVYRNGMRSLASMFCVVLSLSAAWVLEGRVLFQPGHSGDIGMALLGGLAATPIAPLAKEVSSAVAMAIRSRITKAL
jgi:hypothetical protein